MKHQFNEEIQRKIKEIRTISTKSNDASEINKELLNIISNKNEVLELRSEALYEYVNLNNNKALETVLEIANDDIEDMYLRQDAIRYLGRIAGDESFEALLKFLNIEQFRVSALSELAGLGRKEVWPQIIHEIITTSDSYLKKRLAEDFRRVKSSTWQSRSDAIIKILTDSNYSSGSFDPFTILEAMRPEDGWPRNQDSLIGFLINASFDQTQRMIKIIAKLIIECCNGSQTIAGQKIKEFEVSNNIPPERLKDLRINIGGEIALDPIINILEINLRENFQKPISELNQNTKNMWQKTIKYAQYGFIARIGMSIIVFVVGIVLLIISSMELFYGELDSAKIFGVGVSFVTGLGMMLTIVYTGPLKEIRKSINDLGTSSAAFIAYIHRILEISHTFSYYYLNQRITFEEMKTSSELIDDAMKKTVDVLKLKHTEAK